MQIVLLFQHHRENQKNMIDPTPWSISNDLTRNLIMAPVTDSIEQTRTETVMSGYFERSEWEKRMAKLCREKRRGNQKRDKKRVREKEDHCKLDRLFSFLSCFRYSIRKKCMRLAIIVSLMVFQMDVQVPIKIWQLLTNN